MFALTVAFLAGCGEEAKPLFTGDCGDGSRVVGAREVVESRCSRRQGVRAMSPLPPAETPPPANAA